MGPERVCLINPPSLFMTDDRVFPSLGVLSVAAVLRDAGTKVEFLDLSGLEEEGYTEVLQRHVRATHAEIFGITATTPQVMAAAKMSATIKEVKPSARTIIGGPHVTLVNAAWKLEKKHGHHGRAHEAMDVMKKDFDVLVAGNGEMAVFPACVPDAPKVIDADDPKDTSLWIGANELQALPWPARELLDLGTYHYQIEGESTTTVMAQLGCPFGCGFCGGRLSPMLRRVRARTAEDVVAEMVHIYEEHGIKGFMFVDDELNLPPFERFIEMMQRIEGAQQDLGVEWKLRGLNKASLFSKEQAVAMYRAGFRELLFGFESGSQRMLDNMRKGNVEENTRAVEISRNAGLKVKALMSIGHPGESRESVEETREWLMRVKPDSMDYSVITCYPGTPYFDEAVPAPEMGKGIWVYHAPGTSDRLYQVAIDFRTVHGYG